jgi:iron complex outermembrane receptor protein
MAHKIFSTINLLLISLSICAQVDSNLIETSIDTLSIEDTLSLRRNCGLTGYISVSYSPVPTSNNLADALSDGNFLFLKSYGLGSLATPALRGTGASQTAVVWNGWNILSPMNGTLDLSLIPEPFLDYAQIDGSGSSTRYGSGAIGGVITVNTNTRFSKGWETRLSLKGGSFDNYNQSLRVSYSDSIFFNHTRIFNHTANNDFKYINTTQFGQPEVRQTNGALSQRGILQENAIKIGKKQQLDTRIWLQDSHRKLPPTSVQSSNIAFQDDKFLRTTAHWQYVDTKTAWHISTAYFDEYLRYNDAAISLDDTSRSQTWQNKLEAFVYLNNHQLKFGANYNRLKALTESYGTTYFQNQLAFYTDYEWNDTDEKYFLRLSVREDIVDEKLNPWAGSLAFSYIGKIDDLTIKPFLNASRNFRLPTFNDLYWQPGGNPDLEAEIGYSQELGFSISDYNNFSLRATAFNKNIQNMIQWRPIGNIWTPENITSVWSRGLQVDGYFDYSFDEVSMKIYSRYEFIRSTNQKVANNAQNSLDKQLIYVPIHQGNIKLEIFYEKWTFQYNQNFTGLRYISTDNSTSIDGYSIGNLEIHYQSRNEDRNQNQKKKLRYDIHASLNNIWNVNYEVIRFRPMPRRNFQIGISIFFNKK